MATATNISGTITLSMTFNEIVTSGLITQLTLPAQILNSPSYTNGTGALQVDYIYAKSLSLAATPTNLDLTALTDLNGGAVNFARVRELAIVNLATTSAFTVTVGAAASNAWSTGPLGTATSTAILMPNVGATGNYSMMRWSDPYSTGASTGGYVDSTHKVLKLDPGANTITVYVMLVGCSAVS